MSMYAFELLEFDKVLQLVANHLNSPLGAVRLQQMAPLSDEETIRRALLETAEVCRFYAKDRYLNFEGVGDIEGALARLDISGAWLEGPDLVAVLDTLCGVHSIRKTITGSDMQLRFLPAYAQALTVLPQLQEQLQRSLERDGSLKDNASTALSKIRRSVHRQRQSIIRSLESMMRSASVRDALQDGFITQRSGRYVLPVQSGARSAVKGILHGRSDTGTTFFIEPFSIVDDGNRLNELLEEERQECERIYRHLSDGVRQYRAQLRANVAILAQLDLLVAKARTAMRYDWSVPEIAAGPLRIEKGCHPLLLAQLGRDRVIPTTLELGDDHRCVVITGPNTGGKTVALKTVGLLALMALSGLPIPADNGTTIPPLAAIVADIGDEQSLEQSLSTFSAHMTRVREILQLAGPRTLVLLDELGAGTDPLEGAALAQAVLEELLQRGALTLAATHLAEVKVYAAERESVVNAAMLFDEENLKPTYQLVVGSPGQSNGLRIARRLGLPESTMTDADRRLQQRPEDAASLLHRLGEELRQAENAKLQVLEERHELEHLRHRLNEQQHKLDVRRREILEQAYRQAHKLLDRLKRRLAGAEDELRKQEQLIQQRYGAREHDLNEREKLVTWKEAELDEREYIIAQMEQQDRRPQQHGEDWAARRARFKQLLKLRQEQPQGEPQWRRILRQLQQEAEDMGQLPVLPPTQPPPKPPQQEAVDPRQLAPGVIVKLDGTTGTAVIREVDAKRQQLTVDLGNLSSRIPFKRVTAVVGREHLPDTHTRPAMVVGRDDVGMELNIIGQRVEEALPTVERYLDRAMLAGLPSACVIHGHGSGRLRDAVRTLAQRLPFVAEATDGPPEAGGAGQTIIKFKT